LFSKSSRICRRIIPCGQWSMVKLLIYCCVLCWDDVSVEAINYQVLGLDPERCCDVIGIPVNQSINEGKLPSPTATATVGSVGHSHHSHHGMSEVQLQQLPLPLQQGQQQSQSHLMNQLNQVHHQVTPSQSQQQQQQQQQQFEEAAALNSISLALNMMKHQLAPYSGVPKSSGSGSGGNGRRINGVSSVSSPGSWLPLPTPTSVINPYPHTHTTHTHGSGEDRDRTGTVTAQGQHHHTQHTQNTQQQHESMFASPMDDAVISAHTHTPHDTPHDTPHTMTSITHTPLTLT